MIQPSDDVRVRVRVRLERCGGMQAQGASICALLVRLRTLSRLES